MSDLLNRLGIEPAGPQCEVIIEWKLVPPDPNDPGDAGYREWLCGEDAPYAIGPALDGTGLKNVCTKHYPTPTDKPGLRFCHFCASWDDTTEGHGLGDCV